MSAFYDQASLVVVPSGYKSGKIYAQKPLTTDGQLTFTRASTATRVNASGLIESVASGVPRLDYLNSTCPRLLLEPQRTNLVTYSEQLDNAIWAKANLTATTNAIVSPDGYTNADKIVDEINGSGNHLVSYTIGTAGTTYTWSAFMKKAEYNYGQLHAYDKAGAIFDLNAGTVVSSDGISATITNYGNGWFRCTYTFTALNQGVFVNPSKTSTSAYAYSGTIGSGIYIWGCQLEAGAYATSYIPTLGTSVTRVAEVASKTGISSLLSASEYTLYWEGTHIPTSQYNSFMTVYNAANNNLSARFYRNNTNNEVRAAIFNPSTGLSLDLGSGITTQTTKCALRVKAGSYALYVNGTLAASSTSSLAPASTLDSVTLQYFNDTQSFDQKTAQVLFFKTGLTNAQLAELTTL
jgi:hypothetical protein